MHYTGIFQGGGLKSIAYIGAILALEEEGFICNKAAGVSAGAIFASLLLAGYTGKELLEIINSLKIDEFIKKEKSHIKGLINDKGMYSIYYIENKIKELLLNKDIYSFVSFKKNNEHRLKILATNTSKNIPIVFPDHLKYYNINQDIFPVSKAVAMSCTFPIFFKPQKINNNYISDGGIINNFPYNLFAYQNNELVFGFILSNKLDKNIPKNIKIIKLNTKGIKMLNFNLKKEEQFKLIETSYLETKKQLKEMNII